MQKYETKNNFQIEKEINGKIVNATTFGPPKNERW